MAALATYGGTTGLAFCASVGLTYLVREAARRLGYVAKPRADRWHKRPTALFGGVGIYLTVLLTYFWVKLPPDSGGTLLLVCSSGMFFVGLVDDRVQLKPYAKLVGQIVFAALFTYFGIHLEWLPNPALDRALTIFWLVGVTNALNLLDNIDGAAAGVAAIAGSILVYLCHAAGFPGEASLAAAFTGAVAGFLVFNFNPASIFMGDCGSLFLGFFLAGLSIGKTQIGARRNIVAVLAVPVLLLLIPILDTTLVTILRPIHGRSVSQGGRDHTSHRLVRLGLSERGATLMLWALAAASGGLAVLVQTIDMALAVAAVAAFAFGLLFLMIFLGRVKVYEEVDSDRDADGKALLPTLAALSHKRRIFEALNDLALSVFCYYGAFLLLFELPLPAARLQAFADTVPIVVAAQLAVFLALGLYRGLWRYTGMDDLFVIVRSVLGAVAASTLSLHLLAETKHLSLRLMTIDGLLLLVAVGGTRISFRLFHRWFEHRRAPQGVRVLIYGAGDGGELLLRELQSNRALGLTPVGFVDDDPAKLGRVIHGVPVLGPSSGLAKIQEGTQADQLLLSTARVLPDQWERVVATCAELGLQPRRARMAIE